jgi:hypothetical protein
MLLGDLEAVHVGGRFVIFKRGMRVLSLLGVRAIWEEARATRREKLVYLRVFRTGRRARGFFLDRDAVQSNVREVPGRLGSLDVVLRWLLAPGFAYRQGDIGIYSRAIPRSGIREIRPDRYGQAFARLLGGRHRFDPEGNCRYFRAGRRLFVEVLSAVRLVHPEHQAILLPPACYELRSARGRPLARRVPLRVGKPGPIPL